MFLLDTNVISEIRKIHKGTANHRVTHWFFCQTASSLFLNDIVLLEIKQGELLLRHKNDLTQALAVKEWLELKIPQLIGEQNILPITQEICLLAATLHVPNQRDRHDALIAATALTHDLTLVTRNERDFVGIGGLKLFNPFTKTPTHFTTQPSSTKSDTRRFTDSQADIGKPVQTHLNHTKKTITFCAYHSHIFNPYHNNSTKTKKTKSASVFF